MWEHLLKLLYKIDIWLINQFKFPGKKSNRQRRCLWPSIEIFTLIENHLKAVPKVKQDYLTTDTVIYQETKTNELGIKVIKYCNNPVYRKNEEHSQLRMTLDTQH